MNVIISGLTNSGKTTLFNALTGQNLETTVYPTTSGDPNPGVVRVPDSRVGSLSVIFMPKKTTYAAIEYIDFMGITKGDTRQNRKVFDLLKDADAIVHVVRAFEDEAVVHPLSGINPLRDIETFGLELIFGDLEFVEKRLERMDEAAKKQGKKPDESEKKLLIKCRESLMQEIPLREVVFTEDEMRALRPLQFLSTVPEVIVLNIGEKDLHSAATRLLQSSLGDKYPKLPVLALCAKLEMEIAQLPADEIKPFLEELRIDKPASNKLINTCYNLLGLISFLTVGEDEVRAWTIKKGLSALQAAGKVHSDIERGFIRAEVISYEDFIAAGSMHAAREKGLLRLEGKTYDVRDGDIINFRFNV
jgi:ribosome-binding ATPase